MFPYSVFITPFTIFLSLSTSVGVFVHDMKLDTVTLTVIAAPVVFAGGIQLALAAEHHTHSDRGSLSQAVHDAKGANPLLQPRSAHKNKKYLTKRSMLTGHRSLFGTTVAIS